MGSFVRKFGREISDFVFGNYSAGQYRYNERFFIDMFTKNGEIEKDGRQKDLGRKLRRRSYVRFLQTGLTVATGYGLCNFTFDSPQEYLIMGGLLCGKAYLYAQCKRELSKLGILRRKILREYRRSSDEELDFENDKGEEWKRGTDYRLSRDQD